MKKLFFPILLGGGLVAAHGQGSVTFVNRTSAGDAKISRPDGTGAGDGISAQLFLVNANGPLTPVSPAEPFRLSPELARYFFLPIDLSITGVPAGSAATFRIRAWEGSDYESSRLRGESNDVFVQKLGGTPPGDTPPIPTPDLSGLQGFTLVERPQVALSFGASAGTLQFAVNTEYALAATSAVVERSADLITWEPVGTAPVVNGVVQLTDPALTATAAAQSYFRVRFE